MPYRHVFFLRVFLWASYSHDRSTQVEGVFFSMAGERDERLIKSRARVRDHGEVFTPAWLVRAMCDLAEPAVGTIGSRVLEPACGDGNFLVEVLRRKLGAVRKAYGGASARAQLERFRAVSSLYGIDLLPDNVHACRERLYALWAESIPPWRWRRSQRRFDETAAAIRAVLARNILCGNTLSPDGNAGSPPIVLSEWCLPSAEGYERAAVPSAYEVTVTQLEWRLSDLWTRPNELCFTPAPLATHPACPYWEVR